MAQPLSDSFLRRALLAVESAPPLPAALTERVMGQLELKWGARTAVAKPSAALRLWRTMADAPPALLALAAAFLITLGPLLTLSRSMALGRPLDMVAHSAEGAKLSTGSAIRAGRGTGRVLATAAGGHLSLTHGSALALNLFESSRVRFSDERGRLGIELLEGALYLDRSAPLDREVAVRAFGQELRLTGTSLYAERSAQAWLIICGDGSLELTKSSKDTIASWEAGEYHFVTAEGRILERGALASLPPDYAALFGRLRPLPAPGSPDMGRRPAGFHGWSSAGLPPPERPSPDDTSSAPSSSDAAELPPDTPSPEPTEPPFTVSALGKLAGYAPEGGASTFRAPFSLGGQNLLALSNGIYRVTPGGLELRYKTERDIVSPPLQVGSSLLLFHADRLSILTTALVRAAEAAYPDQGSVGNGFRPVLNGKSVILPLQGAGFYRFDPETRTFSLLKAEVFPATPLSFADGWLSASFYRNAYERRGADGAVRWSFTLPGESWLSPLAMGTEIVLYSEEASGQRLIALDAAGRQARSLPLPAKLVSDMTAVGKTLFMIGSNGELLSMDWPGGKTRRVARIHSGGLSSAQARNLMPMVAGSELLTLDTSGTLGVYALPGLSETIKTSLKSPAPFELQPFASGATVYALARDGSLFKVERRKD